MFRLDENDNEAGIARLFDINPEQSGHVETVVLMSRIKGQLLKKCCIFGLFGYLAVSAGEQI